jgi:hypothetical protein
MTSEILAFPAPFAPKSNIYTVSLSRLLTAHVPPFDTPSYGSWAIDYPLLHRV